jgi:hypothetical protein
VTVGTIPFATHKHAHSQGPGVTGGPQ